MSTLRERALTDWPPDDYLSSESRAWWDHATARHWTREWCEATDRPGIWLAGNRTDGLLFEYIEAFLGVRVVGEAEALAAGGRWGSFKTFPSAVADEITAADKCAGALTPDQRAAELGRVE